MEFQLLNVIAEGTAHLNEDTGNLEQRATVVSGVAGNTYEGKFIQTDEVMFVNPSSMTADAIWANIGVQAAAWVQATYPPIP